MSTQLDSDAGPDAEPSPQPTPIESLALELVSRITHLALDPTDVTKHSPENTTTLRSLALVSRAWYHSAVRELVASPRLTSPSSLGVFVNLVDRLSIGSCVKEIHIDGGDLPRQKQVRDVDEDDLVGVDRDALEQQYKDEWASMAGPRMNWESAYAGPKRRLVQICPRIAVIRISGMVLPEMVLHGVDSLPLEAVWIDNSFLSTKPFQHLPSTLRALHLADVPVPISAFLEATQIPCASLFHLSCRRVFFVGYPPARSAPNGTVLDTVTSLVLDTYATTLITLQYEYFPELTHLEVVETDGPQSRSSIVFLPSMALAQLHRLPKLKVLTVPDPESWREAWEEFLDRGDRDHEGLEVVWKPVV